MLIDLGCPRIYAYKTQARAKTHFFYNSSYAHYAISVRTASVIPIESARVARSYKNDPHHWRQLCIEGNSLSDPIS